MTASKKTENHHGSPARNSGKITCPLIVVILAVSFGTDFQVYSSTVINNLVDTCQKWMNQSFADHYGYHLTDRSMNLLWSFSTAAAPFGAFTGSMFTRFLADRYGRRKSLILLAVISGIGNLFNGFAKWANAFEMFIIGRFLTGIGWGCGFALASMFISEIAPVKYRGACGATQQLLLGFGHTLSFILSFKEILGTEELWPIAVSVPPFIASLTQFFVLLFFAYDSPRFMVSKDCNDEEEINALKFYQGDSEANERLKEIKDEEQKSDRNNGGEDKKSRFFDVFRRPEMRKPLFISLMIMFGAMMSGVAAVHTYSKSMFLDAGLNDQTAQYATVGVGLCNFLSPILTMLLVERVGRKIMMLFGLILCDIALISLTICLFGSHWHGWPGAALGAMPCIYMLQIGFAIASSISLIAPAEMFPQDTRASAIGVIFTFKAFMQLFTILAYLPFAKAVGNMFSYLPFMACVTTALVVLGIFMPETKGKTVDEVMAGFRKR